MKIAYIYDVIYPYTKGGAEKRFWELAKRLAAWGHDVHLYGMKSWEGERHFTKDGVHLHGVGKHRELYTKSGTRSIWQVCCFTFKILPALMRQRFDIIDCNAFPYLPIFCVKLFSLCKKIPLVITWQEAWGNYWYNYLGFLKGGIGRAVERAATRLSSHIIVHSRKIKMNLIAYGVAEKNIKLIPDGVDLKFIEEAAASQERNDLIFVGRLIKDKNVDILIRAAAILKKEIPDIRCLLIGEGPEKESLMNFAQELGLKDNIVFKGSLEYAQVISDMKASKVFVFPSSREGFGIVAIEAMACGLPVITVNHPLNAVTELIRDGENGFICAFNEKEVAEKAALLLKDSVLRTMFSESAMGLAADYDWDRIAQENQEYYKSIIG